MKKREIEFHRRAKTAISSLSESEQEQIHAAIECLEKLDTRKLPKGKVYKVEGPDEIYVLRVDKEMRVLFKIEEDGTILVLDLVFRDTLATFAS